MATKKTAAKSRKKVAVKKARGYVIAKKGMRAYDMYGTYIGKITEKNSTTVWVYSNGVNTIRTNYLRTKTGKLLVPSVKYLKADIDHFINAFENPVKKQELSTNDKKHLMPALIQYLKTRRGRKMAVNNHWLCRYLTKKCKVEVSYRILQLLINEIRKQGTVKLLIASSEGYFVSTTNNETANYLRGLKSRISDLNKIYRAIALQIEKSK